MNGAIFIDKREKGEVIIPFSIASIILRAMKEGNIARLEVE